MNLKKIIDAKGIKKRTSTTPAEALSGLINEYFQGTSYEDPSVKIEGKEVYVGGYYGPVWGVYTRKYDKKEGHYVRHWHFLTEDDQKYFDDSTWSDVWEKVKSDTFEEEEVEEWAEERDDRNQRESW